jgi:hypothetical protein
MRERLRFEQTPEKREFHDRIPLFRGPPPITRSIIFKPFDHAHLSFFYYKQTFEARADRPEESTSSHALQRPFNPLCHKPGRGPDVGIDARGVEVGKIRVLALDWRPSGLTTGVEHRVDEKAGYPPIAVRVRVRIAEQQASEHALAEGSATGERLKAPGEERAAAIGGDGDHVLDVHALVLAARVE